MIPYQISLKDIICDCIEKTLKETLGESATTTLLYHVGKASDTNIETFAESLERIFGSGAHILERCILEKLYSQVGKTFQEKEGYKFVDYVNELRDQWPRKQSEKVTEKQEIT